MIDKNILKIALKNGCPKCGHPSLYAHYFTLDVKDSCCHCGLDLRSIDSGDGPAVFLIFILGFLMTPLALLLDAHSNIPLWIHAIIWSVVGIGLCLLSMQRIKSYVLALNYKHRGSV